DVAGLALRDFSGGHPAALGALVTAEEDDATIHVFLVPAGGGLRIDGDRVQVVTPKSPLGAALLGKREGDDAELRAGGRVRELAIVSVR
ncbi:MAG: GreA/GreB family elongation factor, partial [Polyangiaceae bacterium]